MHVRLISVSEKGVFFLHVCIGVWVGLRGGVPKIDLTGSRDSVCPDLAIKPFCPFVKEICPGITLNATSLQSQIYTTN